MVIFGNFRASVLERKKAASIPPSPKKYKLVE